MQQITTISTDSDLRANLAKDIAEGLATGCPDYRVRTPAHRSAYTPLLDVVSEAIGAPQDPILTQALALAAAGLKSSDAGMVRLATGFVDAVCRAHIDAQLEAYVEQDAEAAAEAEFFPFARAA